MLPEKEKVPERIDIGRKHTLRCPSVWVGGVGGGGGR